MLNCFWNHCAKFEIDRMIIQLIDSYYSSMNVLMGLFVYRKENDFKRNDDIYR